MQFFSILAIFFYFLRDLVVLPLLRSQLTILSQCHFGTLLAHSSAEVIIKLIKI